MVGHPCNSFQIIRINPELTQVTFRVSTERGDPGRALKCNFTAYVTAGTYSSGLVHFSANNGISGFITINNLLPNTNYTIHVQNDTTGREVTENTTTRPFAPTFDINPLIYNAGLRKTSQDFGNIDRYIGRLRQLNDDGNVARDVGGDEIIRFFPIRFTNNNADILSLESSTLYDFRLTGYFRGSRVPYHSDVIEFTTRNPRCTAAIDKHRVIQNRLGYALNFEKMSHLLRKLFQKVANRAIDFQGALHGRRIQRYQRAYNWVKNFCAQPFGQATFHLELYQLLWADSSEGRIQQYINAHPQWGPQDTPWDLPPVVLGGGGAGMIRYFVDLIFTTVDNNVLRPMTVVERQDYFRDGFPGGDAAFTVFLNSLVRLDADGNPVPTSRNDQRPQRVDDTPLTFVFRASNIGDPYRTFGFIYLYRGRNEGQADPILTHLTIGELYRRDENGEETNNLYRVVNNSTMTYHITDGCFNIHIYYSFENSAYRGRSRNSEAFIGEQGDADAREPVFRINTNENDDEGNPIISTQYTYTDERTGRQAERTARSRVVQGTRRVNYAGGKRRKAKSRKQKTRK